jgi:hypothetical protein
MFRDSVTIRKRKRTLAAPGEERIKDANNPKFDRSYKIALFRFSFCFGCWSCVTEVMAFSTDAVLTLIGADVHVYADTASIGVV